MGGRPQFGPLQGAPRPWLSLSCREIRRLFWQLVLIRPRTPPLVLHWSGWRRWHQAWAAYYHHRRRGIAVPGQRQTATPAARGVPLEPAWQRLAACLPPAKRPGRPYAHDRRVILEAIVYVMQTGCAWPSLPTRFPPWQTVYAQFDRWRKAGIWEHIWAERGAPSAPE